MSASPRRFTALGAFLAGTLGFAAAAAAIEVPFLTGRVNDYADLLSPDARQRLEKRLDELERTTGTQVAVLTIESLDGAVLEDYALEVAETWALGHQGRDDGVLFLVARDDRKMRLEVGYGLEPRLPDLLCKRILDEVVRPHFRQGDFASGVEKGVEAIFGTLEGRDAVAELAPEAGGELAEAPVGVRIGVFGGFMAFISLFVLGALFSPGCSSWFMYLFLTPFLTLFPGALLHPMAGWIIGGAWLLLFPLFKLWIGTTSSGKGFLKRHPVLTTFSRAGSSWGGGGWSSGGSSFSGGGGSFGGGGASSGW